MRNRQWSWLVVLIGLAAVPQEWVVAQRVSLAPTVGVYFPTEKLLAGEDLVEQEVSIAVGGELGIGFSRRVRLTGTGTYVPSDLKFSLDGSRSQEDANLFIGSGRLVVDVLPLTSPISLRLGGGLGVVNRSGAAYADQPDRTDLGGMFGVSLGVRLGRILSLQFGADNYMYKPQFIEQVTRQTQRDVHLSFGIGIPLLGFGFSSGDTGMP